MCTGAMNLIYRTTYNMTVGISVKIKTNYNNTHSPSILKKTHSPLKVASSVTKGAHVENTLYFELHSTGMLLFFYLISCELIAVH